MLHKGIHLKSPSRTSFDSFRKTCFFVLYIMVWDILNYSFTNRKHLQVGSGIQTRFQLKGVFICLTLFGQSQAFKRKSGFHTEISCSVV